MASKNAPQDVALTPETFDAILDKITARLKSLREAVTENNQAEGSEDLTPSRYNVKRKKTMHNMLEPLGEARDFMWQLLKHETGTHGRPELQAIFGGDCRRVARLQISADTLAWLLAGSHLVEDERLRDCVSACKDVMGVLSSVGMGDRVAAALAIEREEVDTLVMGPTEAERELVRSLTSSRTRARTLSQEGRLRLIQDIDDGETAKGVLEKIDTLFDAYDRDRTELLEGEAYETAMQDLTTYVLKEAEEIAAMYKMPSLVPSENLVKQWVQDTVDPNQDGAVTRVEARVGFKKVVDDYETGKDSARSKRKEESRKAAEAEDAGAASQ